MTAELLKDGRRVPLDFFSWHCYNQNPYIFGNQAKDLRKYLDDVGYTDTELILDEWNYLINFGDRFVESIENIISMRGAALYAAMCYAQSTPMDMFMYYDLAPGVFNGLFDFYTLKPIKGYYSFLMFSRLYELGTQVKAESDDRDVIVCAAKGENECVMITYYGEEKMRQLKRLILKDFQAVTKPNGLVMNALCRLKSLTFQTESFLLQFPETVLFCLQKFNILSVFPERGLAFS